MEQCEYMENFLGIAYIQQKTFYVLGYSTSITWKNSYYIFRVRMLISNIMEIKRQFSLDTNLKLMDQVLQVLVGTRDKFYH
jgi:hypothetical protein